MIQVSRSSWNKYVEALGKINAKAVEEIRKYVARYGFEDLDALIEFSHSIVTKYGEASSELACQMCETIMQFEMDANLDLMFGAIEPPEMPTIEEIGEAIGGAMKESPSGQKIEGTISRLVKQTAADTVIHNGIKSGAEFAWIPNGDTCPFCLTIASRGWQTISRRSLKKGHAEHVHGNCDCQYMIRHDPSVTVEGYDPDEYLKMYYGAEGRKPQDKINYLRRQQYAENRDAILERQRSAYAQRQQLLKGQ